MRTVVWDLECTNLRSNIGQLIVASFGELGPNGKIRSVQTRDILQMNTPEQMDGEAHLVDWVKEQITAADIIIGFNSTAFDEHFVNGVLMRQGKDPLPLRFHLDVYQVARAGKWAFHSLSLENLAGTLGLNRKKYKPEIDCWREWNRPESIAILRRRCEEDVRLTAEVWERLKPTYMRWKGR